ncbi:MULTISPECIES: aminotransferase class V-fold PLP-dependent enzyme [Bacillus cereus group]|uniref:aminotransferase class V-fold PLP-dependent enzyme n=1 Tax=Bacillus cereus group TaxID=86661 RepID=UPI001298C876|nr:MULTISPECIES: aminotransferase class V-fold PLP-dependent enzyme [Bacillus cereus group]MCR6787600.1 aminotransferase class V-fold PLP-dependent enzyme [Bacillus thuringiensis]MCR6822715.1 aminotransferase class V-fold PLP-dependent enzyme [Bacillus thuringiensis]MCR6829676.1 aminotransferase class V-fold PLP-dependent enzyme [Bacillus thuringiensis]MEB8931029.1 aminotransferase class V-fold PLP-dependent enzyme [Bacillus cereus]MEB9328232.1 aminotransferase class V-fold PLP-dependent enzym
MGLIYKVADQDREFERIHKLNYKTFVEEIPQHEETKERVRIDRFHDENTYLICLDEDKLVGMVALRGKRPFSLDYKISNLDFYLQEHGENVYEIRLLSVEREYRNGRALLGLIRFLHRYLLLNGYELALISATTRELPLYEQMGFKSFHTLVGTEEAAFQPMYVTPAMFEESSVGGIMTKEYTFLPGPVDIEENVRKAFSTRPISHRSKSFQVTMDNVKKRLLHMTKAKHVQLMLGTGTLANDAIALQLRSLKGKGLILTNGEFGNRLVGHAKRAQLHFDTYKKEMGEPFIYNELEEIIITGNYEWLWFVHHETSTGMLNDLDELNTLCNENQMKLCVDCISSIGAIPLDLKDVYFASGVSGKAIKSYTGISFVFHNHIVKINEAVPAYMDIGMYEENENIPYSQSWNLIYALQEALKRFEDEKAFVKIKETYDYVEEVITDMGLKLVSTKEHAAPIILTIVLSEEHSSKVVGDALALQGYVVHYESSYLQKNNWIQIACLNHYKERDMKRMLNCLQICLFQSGVHI